MLILVFATLFYGIIPRPAVLTSVSFACSCLAQRGYAFRTRGQIEVKGKGKMTTYFLVGSPSRDVREPDDEFLSLPVERSTAPDESRYGSEGQDVNQFADLTAAGNSNQDLSKTNGILLNDRNESDTRMSKRASQPVDNATSRGRVVVEDVLWSSHASKLCLIV